MPRANQAQLNIRSAFARARVDELTKRTGMTAKQIVEDALRGYVAPVVPANVGRMVRKGKLFVLPSQGHTISFEEAEAALNAVRERDLDY